MDSYVRVNNGSTSFVGLDATRLYSAIQLRAAIVMYAKYGIIPTRVFTITKLLVLAQRITRKPYKRGHHAQAIDDLTTWIEAMKCGLPIIDGRAE